MVLYKLFWLILWRLFSTPNTEGVQTKSGANVLWPARTLNRQTIYKL